MAKIDLVKFGCHVKGVPEDHDDTFDDVSNEVAALDALAHDPAAFLALANLDVTPTSESQFDTSRGILEILLHRYGGVKQRVADQIDTQRLLISARQDRLKDVLLTLQTVAKAQNESILYAAANKAGLSVEAYLQKSVEEGMEVLRSKLRQDEAEQAERLKRESKEHELQTTTQDLKERTIHVLTLEQERAALRFKKMAQLREQITKLMLEEADVRGKNLPINVTQWRIDEIAEEVKILQEQLNGLRGKTNAAQDGEVY